MADGDGVTDVVDISGNGKGVAINIWPDVPPSRSFIEGIANLKAASQTTYENVFLADGVRSGWFEWIAGNLTSKVSVDTAQGIYVASNSDLTGATGAWVRKFDGPINPQWFGVVAGNAAGANGAANSTALNVMFATMKARAVNIITLDQGLEDVRFPAGYFEFASTIDITDGTFIFEGIGQGRANGHSTLLKFPSGVTGIRVQRYNTSGATTLDGVTHRGGDGTTIRNLCLTGAYTSGTGEMEAHGIHLRAAAIVENVFIDLFEGDGIYTNATAGGSPEGNSNIAYISTCRAQRCRNGIFFEGNDANIWTVIAVDVRSNRQWGVLDSSFLGNSFFGLHASTNGVTVGALTSMCSHGGNRYAVKVGQEVGASTNAPTGTTADNTWWLYVTAGGPLTVSANIPAWVTGLTWRQGGSYCTDNGNAKSQFDGCYAEGGYGPPQVSTRTIINGGFAADVSAAGCANIRAENGFLTTRVGWRVEEGTFSMQIGDGVNPVAMKVADSVNSPSDFTLALVNSSRDLSWYYLNGANTISYMLGPNTTQQFGTGAAVPYAFFPVKLMVGDSLADARRISNGTAAPSTGAHGAGEFHINRAPASASDPVGWRCRVAGTPGTWDPIYSGVSFSVQSVASAATVTPTFSNDAVNVTAQNAALDLANWSGSAVDFWSLVVRIKDDGTARALTYGANYQAVDGVTLPTTTVVGKTHELAFTHNSQTGKHVCTSAVSY